MNRLKKLLLSLPATVLVVSAISVPVYAHQSDHEVHAESTTSSTENETSDDSRSGRRLADRTNTETENETENSGESMHTRGMRALEKAKKEHKELKSDSQRKKVCEARKKGIENRTNNVVTRAKRHLTRIDDVFTKVQAYKTDNNLTIDNWDALVQTATDAQTKATTSVNTLSETQPKVDCTNSDTLLTDLATYKEATAQARKDLIAYRKAVQSMIHVIMSAKDTTSTSEGSTN